MRTTLILALLAVACGGGSSDEEAKKMAEEQAAKTLHDKNVASGAVTYKTEVPVMGGHRIDCADLFPDVAKFGDALSGAVGAKETVSMRQLDKKEQIHRQPGVNAICEFVREGKRPSTEEQKKLAEKTQRLGTLPGDVYCEVRVDCGKPFDEDWETHCRAMTNHDGHRDLGVFACIMKSIRAERDAFRYKLFEPDTKCYLDILGGASVTDDPIPRACAKTAMEEITADSIAKYKNLGPVPKDIMDKTIEATTPGGQ